MALKMERQRPKQWIMSQDLNRTPYGSNLVGIEAAAQGWFGKSAKDLGLGEAAMLAGMVQAPSRFRPDRHYDRALKRRDYVLIRMLSVGMITSNQFEAAKSVCPGVKRAPRPFMYPHFCDWTLQKMRGGESWRRLHGDHKTALTPTSQAICENAVQCLGQCGGYSAAAVVVGVSDGETVRSRAARLFRPEGGIQYSHVAASCWLDAQAFPCGAGDRPRARDSRDAHGGRADGVQRVSSCELRF